MVLDGPPSNGLPLSCAALVEWNGICVMLTCKMAPISGPRSGVSYSALLGDWSLPIAYISGSTGPHGTTSVSIVSHAAQDHTPHNGHRSDR